MSPTVTDTSLPTEQLPEVDLASLPAPTGSPVVIDLPIRPLGIDIALDPRQDPGAPRWAAPPDLVDETTPTDDAVADPRFVQRRARVAADRRRRRRHRLGWVLAAVATAAAGVGVAASPLLDVDRIEIIGSDQLTLADVAGAGLSVGDPMLTVDADDVAARLGRDPRFVRVAVSQRFPSEVAIRVTDRRRIARVAGPTRSAIVGEGGIVIAPARGDEFVRTVEVTSDPPVRPGRRLDDDLAEAIDVVGAMPIELAFQVTSVRITDDLELTFELASDRVLLFGTVEHADRKLLTATTMLGPQIDLAGVCLVDVRVPSAPTMRRNPACDPPPPVDPNATVDPAAAPVVPADGAAPASTPTSTPPTVPAPTTAPPTTAAPTATDPDAPPLLGGSTDDLLTDQVPDAAAVPG